MWLTLFFCSRGESSETIVSDIAAVGKKWMTTIALRQYMMYKDLGEIVFVQFLEKKHCMYLADMLFWSNPESQETRGSAFR